MIKFERKEQIPEYKGFSYGENSKGEFVVLPHAIEDIDSPHSIHIAPAECKMTGKEKVGKAKEYIDFLTTLEEGYEHIAGHAFHESDSKKSFELSPVSRSNPNELWWVKVESGITYISNAKVAPDGLAYPRPQNHEWQVASHEQIQRLNQLPLMKII